MINLEIKNALASYGLDEHEIKIYLALLKLGNATVKEISETAKIKRTTIYSVAEKMFSKGIIGKFKAKYGTHYIAPDPKELVGRLDSIRADINQVMPQLKALKKKEDLQPQIEFYSGKEGYFKAINESLNGESKEIYYFGSESLLTQIIGEKFILDKYIPARLERNIRFKELVIKEDFSEKLVKNQLNELREIKFLPTNIKPSANKLIYSRSVAYFLPEQEMTTIIIQSQNIAKTERNSFELLWSKLD